MRQWQEAEVLGEGCNPAHCMCWAASQPPAPSQPCKDRRWNGAGDSGRLDHMPSIPMPLLPVLPPRLLFGGPARGLQWAMESQNAPTEGLAGCRCCWTLSAPMHLPHPVHLLGEEKWSKIHFRNVSHLATEMLGSILGLILGYKSRTTCSAY